eukprot:Skav234745  [mRNA]  locus=scaffold14:534678:536023:- [translate_table: standard]
MMASKARPPIIVDQQGELDGVPIRGKAGFATSTPHNSVMTLQEVVSSSPLPVAPITTKGRIVYVFGQQSKYPEQKVVLGSKAVRNAQGESSFNSETSLQVQHGFSG